MTRVALIGFGGLGQSLADALEQSPEFILSQIFVKSESSLATARQAFPHTEAATDLRSLKPDTDWILIAVPDTQVPEVAKALQTPLKSLKTKPLITHTAASRPLADLGILRPQAETGVFYPLQTFSRGRRIVFSEVPLFLESDPPQNPKLERWAKTLSGTVSWMDSADRLVLHTGAVLVSNFVNHLVTLADRIASHAGGNDYHVYLPLLRETLGKLSELHPLAAQTGPAIRGDTPTLERHREILLRIAPEGLPIYEAFTASIQAPWPKSSPHPSGRVT